MTQLARYQKLRHAEKLIKQAAQEVAEALDGTGHPALERLAGEIATMGAVAECIACAMRDELNEQAKAAGAS